MKPASTKSRIAVRLASLLLIPVVFSSSVNTVYVAADDEVTITPQVEEAIQETTEDTQVTVEVEEPSDSEQVEDTVVESGDAEFVEGEEDPEEIEAPVEGEESSEESEETEEEVVEGEAEEGTSPEGSDLTEDEILEKLGLTREDYDALCEEFSDLTEEEITAELQARGFTEEQIALFFSLMNADVEGTADLFTSSSNNSNNITIGDICFGADSSSCDDKTELYSTKADDLKVSVEVKGSNIRGVYIEVNGSFIKMDRKDNTNIYTWTPNIVGNYELGKIKVTSTVRVSLIRTETVDTYSDSISKTLCYYNAPTAEIRTNPTYNEDDWYSKTVHNKDLELTLTVSSIRKISEIVVNDKSETVSDVEPNDGKYVYTITYTVPSDENGQKTYKFCYKYAGSVSYSDLKTVTVKVDNTAYEENSFDGQLEVVESKKDKELKAIVTFANKNDIAPSDAESGLVKVECVVKREAERLPKFFADIILRSDITRSAKISNDFWESESSQCVIDIDDISKLQNEIDDLLGVRYYIESITLTDLAGNSFTKKYDDSNKKEIILDDKSPIVEFDLPHTDNVFENVYLYNDNLVDPKEPNGIKGSVIIGDYSLDSNKTNLYGIDGFVRPDFSNEYLTFSGNNNSRTVQQEYWILTSTKDGYENSYKFNVNAEDTNGKNIVGVQSPTIVIDKKAPGIIVSIGGKTVTGNAEEIYKNDTLIVRAEISDPWLVDPTSSFILSCIEGDSTITEPSITWKGEFGENGYGVIIETEISGNGKYSLSVDAADYAGNKADFNSGEFIFDNTSPTIDISFNTDDARNGKYYNLTRVATITVEDYTFDAANSVIDVTSKYGQAKVGPWEQDKDAGTTKTYKATVEFAEDGYYSFTVKANDLAKNPQTEQKVDEFVIDKTAPEIKVSYDFNDARNGMYYRNDRNATVDIEDISFSSELVNLTSQTLEDVSELPQLGGFVTNDKQNTAHLSFTVDGTYGYIINCEDLAGNVATTYTSDVFVIDRTAPEVTFAGVENFSANNGTVAPSVTYVDKYMDMEATVVTLTGSNNGAVTLESVVNPTENGFVVSYSDFERTKAMDDLYTLDATVVDLAGNETKEQLVFSVNRFGSVFVLGDAAKALNEEYYTNEPKDVSITEINVDELTYRDVSISKDGSVKELKNGRQYQVTKQGSDTSWKTYTYTISKDNFNKDGVYSVTVYTKDRATNVQDNKSRDAEVNFAVDMTAPSIVAAGIKSGETYKEATHTVNIDVTDNMGVTNLAVYKDGEEIEAYDADALSAAGGVESITLNESDEKQTITIVAEDVAGNVETLVYEDILVSTKETTDIGENETPKKDTVETDPAISPDDTTRSLGVIIFAIVAFGVVAAGAGAGAKVYKKKSSNK